MTTRQQDNTATAERVRASAKVVGWAIGVHGSLERDVDLIGVPWTCDAVDADSFIDHLTSDLGLEVLSGRHSQKPCGRRATLLTYPDAEYTRTQKGTWTPAAIDLSIMDPRHD